MSREAIQPHDLVDAQQYLLTGGTIWIVSLPSPRQYNSTPSNAFQLAWLIDSPLSDHSTSARKH